MHKSGIKTLVLSGTTIAVLASIGSATKIAHFSSASAQTSLPQHIDDTALQAACTPDTINRIASSLKAGVVVKPIRNGATVPKGTRFYPAKNGAPAFCQAVGNFVTDPATGKTANFMATLPANWNGKYMQIGCSGHCGQFFVSDPAMPTIVITSQGKPMDAIKRGYAAFATDEGHEGLAGGTWAIKGPGQVDQGAIEDLYYRADKVLATVGKRFAVAFYSALQERPVTISRSYFNGCSGGGRDALVAASYFPDAFDGIISGSPANMAGVAFQFTGSSVASLRSPGAYVPPELFKLIDPIVKAQCDAVDGVKDGLIQNPAACNFRPERDLPICKPGSAPNSCFNKEQTETVSALLNAVTDEKGNVVQPGLSVSDVHAMSWQTPKRPSDLSAIEPFPGSDNGDVSGGGYWALGDAILKVFVHGNDPTFHSRSLISFRRGGPGPVSDFHIVVPSSEVSFLRQKTRTGTGHIASNYDGLMRSRTKLLIWHNLSDTVLTPFGSTNLYRQLARRYGGMAKVQQSVRLFGLPGTPHCSMGGDGPNSFDALGAMENWVERGKAPDALIATNYPVDGFGIKDFSKPAGRSMPLCKFPEMARYKGTGSVADAANWSCSSSDSRMLVVGESGKQAGASTLH